MIAGAHGLTILPLAVQVMNVVKVLMHNSYLQHHLRHLAHTMPCPWLCN